MKNKKSTAIILGVSFVWFTTHFGGGFASGAQIYSYYVRYGIWCILMPAFAMLYNAIFFAYSLHFAKNMKFTTTALTTMHFTGNSRQSSPTCLKCSTSASCAWLPPLPSPPAARP